MEMIAISDLNCGSIIMPTRKKKSAETDELKD